MITAGALFNYFLPLSHKSDGMKKILFVLLIVAFSSPLFSQKIMPDNYSRHDDYMLRAQRKQHAGIILLSAGGAAVVGGTILIIDGVNRNNRNLNNGDVDAGDIEIILGVGAALIGIGAMSASIPFFVGAHRCRIKAMSLSLKTETVPAYHLASFSKQQFPALAIRIPLGK